MASSRATRSKPYARPSRGDVDGQWVHDKAPMGPRKQQAPPSGPRADRVGPQAALNTKLLVGNLHYEVTPKDLTSIFGQIGTLAREPLLLYDTSGRSEGKAILSFETPAEATRARKQFDGILAKGQPMQIGFYVPPSRPRRATSAPTTASLLQRIEKPSLAQRISQDDTGLKQPPSRPANSGPVRNRGGRGGPVGGGAGGGGGRRGGGPANKGPKKPKTAEELDRELDAFMGDSEETPAAAAIATGDVDMV